MSHPSDSTPKAEVCAAAKQLDADMRAQQWPEYLGTYAKEEIEEVKRGAIQIYDYVVREVPAIDRRTGERLDGWVALYGR
jgi:hypothetical protein